MNEFQLFLSLSQEIPARSAVEFVRKECVTPGFNQMKPLSSFISEVHIWHQIHARHAQARRSLRVAILRKEY
jgi:hypothetical protein